ncbi:hypothetical protein D9M69_111900 [compost metagenome]
MGVMQQPVQHRCRQRLVASAPDDREVGLHFLAWGRLEAHQRLGLGALMRRQKHLELADAAVVAALAQLAQQHGRRNPAWACRLDSLQQIAVIRFKLRRSGLTRPVPARLFVAQIAPHRVARQPRLPCYLPHSHTSFRQYPDFHCLLLCQHRRQIRHPPPGGSVLLRRGGSFLHRR